MSLRICRHRWYLKIKQKTVQKWSFSKTYKHSERMGNSQLSGLPCDVFLKLRRIWWVKFDFKVKFPGLIWKKRYKYKFNIIASIFVLWSTIIRDGWGKRRDIFPYVKVFWAEYDWKWPVARAKASAMAMPVGLSSCQVYAVWEGVNWQAEHRAKQSRAELHRQCTPRAR